MNQRIRFIVSRSDYRQAQRTARTPEWLAATL